MGRGARRLRYSYKSVPDPVLSPGFRALVLYSIVTALSYVFALFVGLLNPEVFALAQIRGTLFWGLNIVIAIVIASMIYGIRYRKHWAYPLALFWFLASVLLSLLALFMVDTSVLPIMRNLLWVMTIAVIALDLAALWFIANRKKYFADPEIAVRQLQGEHLFVRVMGCCWILLIVVSTILGMNFYHQVTNMADQSAAELSDTTLIHALVLCDTKQGQARDVCYVVMASMFPQQDLAPICDRIQSEFFRFTCVRARAHG